MSNVGNLSSEGRLIGASNQSEDLWTEDRRDGDYPDMNEPSELGVVR